MPAFASRFALTMALATLSLGAPTLSIAAQSTQTPAERNFNQGEAYFKANNWAAAIPYYKAAVAADPSFAAAFYSLGLACYQNKDPKAAAAAFKAYLKLKPNDAPGLLLLGISLKDAGDDAGAVDALQSVINLKPEAKYLNSAYYNMGVAYENAHQLPEAMRTYIVLRTISPDDAQDLLNYMRSVDPDLKAADASGTNSPGTSSSPNPVAETTSKPGAAPASAPKPAASQSAFASSAQPKTAALPDLPDLPAARTAIQAANMIGADDLTLTDVIFVLQYRDASTSNQAAAKKVWSEVLDKEKDGEPLQISNAMVISSTKTTVELALSDDCKHAKTADTHLILAKSMSAPARAGVVTNISGVITSYKTDPFVLTIERGELLSATSAASTAPSPSAPMHTTQSNPSPAPAVAHSAAAKRADGWIAYGNSDGNFTALMPIQPKITPNAANQGQVSNTIQALADDGVAYT
ncbi:MAG TPA: tetratricopeptide repeat protein, partial [Candidatus Acidoferrales bacterium]|nr:tetratricopeptide repeat protein [Candidatus Acidoferrales bacterium]